MIEDPRKHSTVLQLLVGSHTEATQAVLHIDGVKHCQKVRAQLGGVLPDEVYIGGEDGEIRGTEPDEDTGFDYPRAVQMFSVPELAALHEELGFDVEFMLKAAREAKRAEPRTDSVEAAALKYGVGGISGLQNNLPVFLEE